MIGPCGQFVRVNQEAAVQLDEFESKEEFIDVYKVWLMYVNKTVAWTYHYFTWEVGADWQKRYAAKLAAQAE